MSLSDLKRGKPSTPVLLVAGLVLLAGAGRAQAPHRMELPAPQVTLAGDSLVVPMESWKGIPVVRATLDGRGPFAFVLDSGAHGSVIAKALADSLKLPVAGQVQIGSPLGGKPVPATLVRVERLAFGKGLRVAFSGVAADLPLDGPERAWSVLSPREFTGLLVTWDYPGKKVVFRRGSLPAPDGREIFSYEGESLPTVTLEIAGVSRRAHLDTGSSGGLRLPAGLRDSLPFAAPPVEGRVAKTVDREVKLLTGRLTGKVAIGRHEFADPEVELVPFAPVANVGSRLLKDFEVTLDAGQHRIQLRRIRAGG